MISEDVPVAGWNFADVWETVADAAPDRAAQLHAGRRHTWAAFDRRADGVAAGLLAAGLGHQDVVALALYNGPEYLEAEFAVLKAGLVPANTNYRYGPDELAHVWNDSGASAVVFHGALTGTVAATRDTVPGVRFWVHADDGTEPCPGWAVPYEELAASADGRTRAPWGRSGDDRLLIYTGGTTGAPKGVVWRQDDFYRVSDVARDPDVADLDHVRSRVAGGPGPLGLPASPLMHGTGFAFAGTLLSRGGTVVTAAARRLDVAELLDLVSTHRVSALCIVGDAFCAPIVEALESEPERWDVSCLRAVSSSGMVWSDGSKKRLLVHAPDALLVDLLSSSEASGMGRSVTSAGKGGGGRFRLGSGSFVIDENDVPVPPGSGTVGRIAVRGILPLGYHNDPEKTAATFPVIDGERVSVPGDYGSVEADGTVTLLGRGSTSINTGGEKVFPEEVEEALRTHADVEDALVVGVPHERFGSVVAAMVAVRGGAGAAEPDLGERLVEHVRERLARYKAPRYVMAVDSVGRGPNGKADYVSVRRRIDEWLGEPDG